MKIQKINIIYGLLLFALSLTHGAVNVNYGGGIGTNAGTDVANWTTNNTAATNGGAGLAYNWENVTTNTSSVNTGNNNFDVSMQANVNHTIGHGYLFNRTFDLSQTVNGITAMTFTIDFDTGITPNWKPLMVIGGQQYIWADQGTNNPFNGTTQIAIASAEDNANWSTILNNGITNISFVDDGLTPNLQTNAGTVQFGFIQWAGNTLNTLDENYTLAIDQFEVDITYDAVPEPGGDGLLIGFAGFIYVMLQRRRR